MAVGGEFIGMDNFVSLLQNKSYLKGLNNTLYFIRTSVPLNIILSLIVAMLINKAKKGKELFSLLFLIPLVIPSVSMVFFWRSFFSLDGFLNHVLFNLGIERINWLE